MKKFIFVLPVVFLFSVFFGSSIIAQAAEDPACAALRINFPTLPKDADCAQIRFEYKDGKLVAFNYLDNTPHLIDQGGREIQWAINTEMRDGKICFTKPFSNPPVSICVEPADLKDPKLVFNYATAQAPDGKPLFFMNNGTYKAPAAPTITTPILKPPAAPVPPAQAPNVARPTPAGTIVPRSITTPSGRVIVVPGQYVIKYPDPANPGKYLFSTPITEKTQVILPDGTSEEWVAGIKYLFDENEHTLYYEKIEIPTITEINGKTFKKTETTTYMPDGMGGVIPKDAASETTRVKDPASVTKPAVVKPADIPTVKPAEPAEVIAPKWKWPFGTKKPSDAEPAPAPKPKSVPVKDKKPDAPDEDWEEDVPGGAASASKPAPVVVTPKVADFKASASTPPTVPTTKPAGDEPRIGPATPVPGKNNEYRSRVTNLPCYSDEKGEIKCPVIIGVGINTDPMLAAAAAVADAKRQVDAYMNKIPK